MVSLRQHVHLHSPLEEDQACPPPDWNEAPSIRLGGLSSLSRGKGGNTCVTFVMVRTLVF